MNYPSLRPRTWFVQILLGLCLAAAAGRLVYVQVYKAPDILRRAEALRIERREFAPLRGAILDREGRVMAQSNWLPTVVANPTQIKDMDAAAKALAEALSMSADEIRDILTKPPSPAYAPLKRGVTLEEAEAVKALGLDGISVIQEAHRVYPQGWVAAHLIGFVGSDGHGLEGLELYYDELLAGRPGHVEAEFTTEGVPLPGTIRESTPPQHGSTLVLTIDAALQMRLQEYLNEYVRKVDARRAAVIVMDVNTGEILAMAVTPGYDLNRIEDSTPEERRAWPITDVLSPGSIFKPITVAAAIDSGAVSPNTTFSDEGYIIVQGVRLHNWDFAGAPGPQTIAQLLQRSSNVGLIKLGQAAGPETFWRYMERLGLTQPTGIDFPGEGEPYLGDDPMPLDWANMYIGQRFLLSPIQVMRAWAAILNGGYLIQPHLVREIRHADGTVKPVNVSPPERVLAPETSEAIREMLISVIEKGTAKAARTPGYLVGGKTGTAEKFEGGVMKERMTANFMGFAPGDKPKILMLVSIDEPAGQGYGGVVAAPVFRDLLPEVMRTVGIPPDPRLMPSQSVEVKKPETEAETPTPDLRHLPVPTAIGRAMRAGLPVEITGDGLVVTDQVPAPGSPMKPGDKIQLMAKPTASPSTRLVPRLTGMTAAEAALILTELQLVPEVHGSGHVAAQTPKPGTVVEVGSTVSLDLENP